MGWGLGVGYDVASVLGSEVVGIPAAWESWLVTLERSKVSRGPVNPSPLGKQWRHPVCVCVWGWQMGQTAPALRITSVKLGPAVFEASSQGAFWHRHCPTWAWKEAG